MRLNTWHKQPVDGELTVVYVTMRLQIGRRREMKFKDLFGGDKEPNVKADAETKTESAVKAEAETETKPAVKAEAETKTKPAVKAKAETKTKPKVKSRAASKRAKSRKRF